MLMNKVVIVTGGSRGIGAATSLLLAQQGYRVCVNYRTRQQDAEAIVSQIDQAGGIALSYQADVKIKKRKIKNKKKRKPKWK